MAGRGLLASVLEGSRSQQSQESNPGTSVWAIAVAATPAAILLPFPHGAEGEGPQSVAAVGAFPVLDFQSRDPQPVKLRHLVPSV